jgi:hypothetical protein
MWISVSLPTVAGYLTSIAMKRVTELEVDRRGGARLNISPGSWMARLASQ